MSKEIVEVRLHCTPQTAKAGDKVRFDLATIAPSGHDSGAQSVIDAGLCYKTSFEGRWTPNGGESEEFLIEGKGGIPPVYVDAAKHRVQEGTGPAPGYSLEVPEGFNCGSSAWIDELGFGFMLKVQTPGPGIMEVKGHLHLEDGGQLDSQTCTLTVV